MPELLSATAAAELLGIDSSQVRRMARERNLGTRLSNGWVFTSADIDALKSRRPVGRPRKEP